LAGHSAWLAKEADNNLLQPFEERKDFAVRLWAELRSRNFDRVFWAGDGGLFAGLCNSSGHPQGLCEAADSIFSVFEEWRGQKPMQIRVTATRIDASLDPDPSYWCSPDLNAFLKFERQIALPNAFVITDTLRRELVDPGETRRFSRAMRITLPDGCVVKTCVDSTHPYPIQRSANAFEPWLVSQVRRGALPRSAIVERGLTRVGYCTVLDGSRDTDGYADLVPELVESASPVIQSEDRRAWKKYQNELEISRVSGTSLQVRQFTPPLTDDPFVRLRYQIVPYADARAFLRHLEEDPKAAQRYRGAALDVLTDAGTKLPNILASAIVVLGGESSQDSFLVLANRKGRLGGFHAGSWAVSIGEQFMPVTGMRAGRTVQQDRSLFASIRRGLDEELLGQDFTGNLRISVHAFCLEDQLDSYIFLAVADLRPLGFQDLCERWASAVDAAEHNALAAVPLNPSVLNECIEGEALPEAIWVNCSATGRVKLRRGIDKLPKEAQKWQPNSHVRLALALWAATTVRA
jgi:hypothetical protein